MGKGPATVKTIAGTMSVILFSSLMSIVKIQNKGAKLGTMSPMDQVLWRTHLLEASLMGTILFFSLGPFVCLLLCVFCFQLLLLCLMMLFWMETCGLQLLVLIVVK
jgi:hypothetical protein